MKVLISQRHATGTSYTHASYEKLPEGVLMAPGNPTYVGFTQNGMILYISLNEHAITPFTFTMNGQQSSCHVSFPAGTVMSVVQG